MSLSRFPLPSIHLVLEAELHDTLPGRPSVITVLDDDQLDWSPSTQRSTFPMASIGYTPSSSHLMKTIDLRDAEPIVNDEEEQFSFIVHFPDEDDLENDTDVGHDARTRFNEKRPSTSRGFRHDPEHSLGSSNTKISDKRDLSLLIIKTVRKVLPIKALLRRTNRH